MLSLTDCSFPSVVEGVKEYAIYSLDAAGNVTTWNVGAVRMKGYQGSEVIGRNFSIFYTPGDRVDGRPAQVLERAARDGSYGEEGWRVRKDGSLFWADVVVTSLRNPSGTLEGFTKITRDQSSRHEQEELLRQREAALTKSLRERELLLQEVHHRVKNNLQLISSLLNFQCRQLTQGPARESLTSCKERVRSIALIHERLYQCHDYSHMTFSSYVEHLIADIFHATGTLPSRVRLELDLAGIALEVDRAVPCGLLLHELITNAIKHAFPEPRVGTLEVSMRRASDATIELRVADDGVGMGTAKRGAEASLGLHLVEMLVEQLDGRLEVNRQSGTTCRIVFPEKQL